MSEFHNLEDAFTYVRVLQKPVVIPEPKTYRIWKSKPRERIDGGDPVRTPIDRVAARVIAPAPWWAMPPDPKREPPKKIKPPETKTKKQKPKKMDTIKTNNPMLDGKYENKSDRQLHTELVAKGIKVFTSNVESAETLVARAKEATAAIEYLATHVKQAWSDCEDELKEAICDMRAKKFALEGETRQILSAFGDVRKFFLDDRHEEQVKRLSEFVTLCERLKGLKESGFLDDVADTMLNLSK
jgi:hypothetical protein